VQSIIELQPDDFLAKTFLPVKRAGPALSRVLARKKGAKCGVSLCIEKKLYQRGHCLKFGVVFLANQKILSFFPLALKIKGKCWVLAVFVKQRLYLAVLKSSKLHLGGQLGLINAYLRLDEMSRLKKISYSDWLLKPWVTNLPLIDCLTALQIQAKTDFEPL